MLKKEDKKLLDRAREAGLKVQGTTISVPEKSAPCGAPTPPRAYVAPPARWPFPIKEHHKHLPENYRQALPTEATANTHSATDAIDPRGSWLTGEPKASGWYITFSAKPSVSNRMLMRYWHHHFRQWSMSGYAPETPRHKIPDNWSAMGWMPHSQAHDMDIRWQERHLYWPPAFIELIWPHHLDIYPHLYQDVLRYPDRARADTVMKAKHMLDGYIEKLTELKEAFKRKTF